MNDKMNRREAGKRDSIAFDSIHKSFDPKPLCAADVVLVLLL